MHIAKATACMLPSRLCTFIPVGSIFTNVKTSKILTALLGSLVSYIREEMVPTQPLFNFMHTRKIEISYSTAK